MQAEILRALPVVIILMPFLLSAKERQATIEDTGSTNRLGLRVIFDETGRTTVESRSADTRQINLEKTLCKEFIRNLEAVGPLIDIPVVHCPKSVSFGSSLFVEYKSSRSPDISCPSHDLRIGEISKHANQILQAAREATGIPSRTARPHPLPSPAQ